MLVRGLTENELQNAADAVSVEIRELRKQGTGFRFIIKPKNGRWQRTSASYFNHGRKVHAVCWHGHKAFYEKIFSINPKAVIITALARYDGEEGFLARYQATDKNIGAPIAPVRYSEACEYDTHYSPERHL